MKEEVICAKFKALLHEQSVFFKMHLTSLSFKNVTGKTKTKTTIWHLLPLKVNFTLQHEKKPLKPCVCVFKLFFLVLQFCKILTLNLSLSLPSTHESYVVYNKTRFTAFTELGMIISKWEEEEKTRPCHIDCKPISSPPPPVKIIIQNLHTNEWMTQWHSL